MTHPYPFGALADAMGLSENQAAVALQLSGSTRQRYRRDGMSQDVAERMAMKARLHPLEVWPEMAEHIVEAARQARNAYQRRWRQTKRGRASARASKRRWEQAAAGYVRAYNARYRAANPERKREWDRAYWARHGAARNATRRERYRTDPAYRERVLAAQRERDRRRASQEEVA